MSKLTISRIASDSIFFVCSKKLSDSVNFRNYFPRIDQIPLRKLFLKFEPIYIQNVNMSAVCLEIGKGIKGLKEDVIKNYVFTPKLYFKPPWF